MSRAVGCVGQPTAEGCPAITSTRWSSLAGTRLASRAALASAGARAFRLDCFASRQRLSRSVGTSAASSPLDVPRGGLAHSAPAPFPRNLEAATPRPLELASLDALRLRDAVRGHLAGEQRFGGERTALAHPPVGKDRRRPGRDARRVEGDAVVDLVAVLALRDEEDAANAAAHLRPALGGRGAGDRRHERGARESGE